MSVHSPVAGSYIDRSRTEALIGVSLAGYYGPKQYYKDTSRVDANGVFIFEGTDELPGGIYSSILPGNTYFEFI